MMLCILWEGDIVKKVLAIMMLLTAVFIVSGQINKAEAYRTEAVVVNCREWITLRDRPSVYGDSLTRIPLGTHITVETAYTENGFYNVYYAGMWGYCLQEYVRILY